MIQKGRCDTAACSKMAHTRTLTHQRYMLESPRWTCCCIQSLAKVFSMTEIVHRLLLVTGALLRLWIENLQLHEALRSFANINIDCCHSSAVKQAFNRMFPPTPFCVHRQSLGQLTRVSAA